MARRYYDPFEDWAELRTLMPRLLETRLALPMPLAEMFGGAFPVDIFETPEAFTIEAAMPGVDPKAIQLTATADTITIRASEEEVEPKPKKGSYVRRERVIGEMVRTLTMPLRVNPEKITCVYEHGILKVTAPKAEEARPKQIPVKIIEAPKELVGTR